MYTIDINWEIAYYPIYQMGAAISLPIILDILTILAIFKSEDGEDGEVGEVGIWRWTETTQQ